MQVVCASPCIIIGVNNQISIEQVSDCRCIDFAAKGRLRKVSLKSKGSIHLAGAIHTKVSAHCPGSAVSKVLAELEVAPISCGLAKVGIQHQGLHSACINHSVLQGALDLQDSQRLAVAGDLHF